MQPGPDRSGSTTNSRRKQVRRALAADGPSRLARRDPPGGPVRLVEQADLPVGPVRPVAFPSRSRPSPATRPFPGGWSRAPVGDEEVVRRLDPTRVPGRGLDPEGVLPCGTAGEPPGEPAVGPPRSPAARLRWSTSRRVGLLAAAPVIIASPDRCIQHPWSLTTLSCRSSPDGFRLLVGRRTRPCRSSPRPVRLRLGSRRYARRGERTLRWSPAARSGHASWSSRRRSSPRRATAPYPSGPRPPVVR